jgi:hypothetical protein
LTRRAKQAHNDIIAEIVSRIGKREVHLLRRELRNAVRVRRTGFAAFSSNLTRRAKHLHTDIIGKS